MKNELQTIKIDFMNGKKIENYNSNSQFTFMHLLVKDVKDVSEPYVIRIVGSFLDYFSVGEIQKVSTVTYEQISEKVISVPIIFNPTLPFPQTTGRSELQFYIETKEGHQPIGTVNFYFSS